MSESTPLTVNGQQAAVLYTALELAIGDVGATLESGTKASAPFKGALAIQLAAYKAEQARLATAFPTLNGNAQPAK